VRIHHNRNRPIERDREGRRRYSGSDTASPAIAPSPPPESAHEDKNETPVADPNTTDKS
jgi:hypothetical protein